MVHSLLLPDLIRCIVLQHSCRCFCSVLCKLQNVSGSIRVLCGSHWNLLFAVVRIPRGGLSGWFAGAALVYLSFCSAAAALEVRSTRGMGRTPRIAACCSISGCIFAAGLAAVQFACSSYRHLVSYYGCNSLNVYPLCARAFPWAGGAH